MTWRAATSADRYVRSAGVVVSGQPVDRCGRCHAWIAPGDPVALLADGRLLRCAPCIRAFFHEEPPADYAATSAQPAIPSSLHEPSGFTRTSTLARAVRDGRMARLPEGDQ